MSPMRKHAYYVNNQSRKDMRMKPTTLQMNLVAKSLVLLELQMGGPISGEDLVARVEQRCAVMAMRRPDFDFVQWARTTIWGLLETFGESGYVTRSGLSKVDNHEWCVSRIAITTRGEQFLQAAQRESGPIPYHGES
jgi:hypothetical protein